MHHVRAALLLATAAPVIARAQTERFTLNGERVAVHNVAGNVTIETGTGTSVVVEVTRGGTDAKRLRIEQLTYDGRTALCIVYPNERIIYRPRDGRKMHGTISTNVGSEGECRGGTKGIFGGRKVEVRSSGEGVEAWADVRILVPAGRDLKVWNVVGNLTATGVTASLTLDVSSASVLTRRTHGELTIDAGSGDVEIATHTGNLTLDAGSGGVRIDTVEAKTIKLGAGSGELRGTRLSADVFRLDAGSGNVNFSAMSARRVRLDAGSGEVSLGFLSEVDSLTAQSGSGGLTLAFPAGFGAELDIETGSGSITSDFAVQPPHTKRGELRGTIGNGHGRVTVEAGSGDVRLLRAGPRPRER